MVGKYPRKSCSYCEYWWDRPLEKVDLMDKCMIKNDSNLKDIYLRLRVPADWALGRVSFCFWMSFYLSVCFMYSLVSIAVSTQSLFRLTASLSPAVATTRPSKSGTFPLAIATRRWPGTRIRKCFSQVYPLCFCWFVCWLLTNTVSLQWRGALMESKLPAAAMTQPSRFGTRNLEIASQRWPATRNRKFFYQYARTITKKIMLLFWVPVR